MSETDETTVVVDGETAGVHTHVHDHPHDHEDIRAEVAALRTEYGAAADVTDAQEAAMESAEAAAAAEVVSYATAAEVQGLRDDIAALRAELSGPPAGPAEETVIVEEVEPSESEPPENEGPAADPTPRERKRKSGWFG